MKLKPKSIATFCVADINIIISKCLSNVLATCELYLTQSEMI